jgi:hypothetical protein
MYFQFATAQEESEEETILNEYYIEKKDDDAVWLVPYKPEPGEGKKVTLEPGQYFNVSQGIIDRKYNSDIKPEVELNIATHGVEGLVIDVQMEFRYFSGQYLPTNPNVTAFFDPYETRGYIDEPEFINIKSSYYSEVPRDIPQPDYGGVLRFSLVFSSDDVNDTIDVMCGEDDYHSIIRTPYDKSYSSTVVEDGDSDGIEVNTTLCWTVGILFLAVIVIIIVIMHFREKD